MKKTVLAAMGVVLIVAGCGGIRESRLNPFNWFGRAEPRETVAAVATPEDARLLVEQVVDLKVEPFSTGAIIRARGIPPSQGWWDAELVARPLDENGVLVFDFRVFPPIAPTPQGTPRSREITVATSLSNVRLDEVREIVVQGATNALSSRR